MANCIGKHKSPSSETNKVLVQFAKDVTDYSSQYGCENSISYVAYNLSGESSIYPNYGDFTQACVLRTYGPWWQQLPSSQAKFTRTPESFKSIDYIELNYETKVYPTKLEIYETYNPGTVVRILALDTTSDNKSNQVRWFELWSGENAFLPAESRIFTPKLNDCPFPTNLLRLEFNSGLCDYYTELDAVCLSGTIKPVAQNDRSYQICPPEGSSVDGPRILTVDLDDVNLDVTSERLSELCINGDAQSEGDSDNGYFDMLPGEVIQLIVSYLDVLSLARASRSCHLLYNHCYDPFQYTELNLQPYWTQVNRKSLDGLVTRCQHLQRLNLSWCGCHGNKISSASFSRFMSACSTDLTCIYLSCCRFVDNDIIKIISETCVHLNELDLQSCKEIDNRGFTHIRKLTKLHRLNLYRSMVDVQSLIAIIRSCPDLQHLNLGSCRALNACDSIGIELGKHCRNLRSLDLWRARSFSHIGLHAIATGCPQLEELDVGWCPDLRSGSGCLVDLVSKCTRLKKLFLTANRTVCDNDLKAIAEHLTDLEQLDILGTRDVSRDLVTLVLESCRRLRLFDVSFCSGLDFAMVKYLSKKYPQVDFKKSFQN